jgi:S1-C subfamily serine protease
LSANESSATYRRLAAAVVAAAALGAGAAVGLSHAFDSSSSTANPVTIPAAQPAALSSSQLDPAQIYSSSADGVVDIDVSGTVDQFSPYGGQRQSEGEGSGFVIDTKGDIVTNQHVVSGATSITVHFKDGTQAKATVVGSDATTDVAVIRVNVASSKLHPLQLGSSSSVKVGEYVVAIGSPFGLPGSITSGIVSATGRAITSPNGSSIAGTIQTDAAINKGNSGGPLIDATGKVIGVNAQIDSSSGGSNGVGFAIPIDTAKQVADQLLASGKVEHAFLGVRITTVTGSAAGQLGLPRGAQVGSVVSGSPAAKSGLKAGTQTRTLAGETYTKDGDVIVSVDGRTVTSAEQLQAAIAAHKPGDQVTLRVSRSGKLRSVQVTLGNRAS